MNPRKRLSRPPPRRVRCAWPGTLAGAAVTARVRLGGFKEDVSQEQKHPVRKALPGRGISRWRCWAGVAFKNNRFGRGRGKTLVLRWSVLRWRLMLPATTTHSGNILIAGCEGVFGERECPRPKGFLVFLCTGKTVNNHSAAKNHFYLMNDYVLLYSHHLASQYFDKNPLISGGSRVRLSPSRSSRTVGHSCKFPVTYKRTLSALDAYLHKGTVP